MITFDETLEHEQGYRLTITDEQVSIRAKDAAGAFYGVMTLTQVLQQYGNLPDVLSSTEQSGLTPMQVMKQRNVSLPVLEIEDWPDFPRRGVMLDISRDKVPTMKTLTTLVDKLASWKINEFQLYTEHTFAYRHHPAVWADASPITARQTETIVNGIVRRDLINWHRKYWGATNAILIVSGDFDRDQILVKLEETFGKWANVEKAAPRIPDVEQAAPGGVYMIEPEVIPNQGVIQIGHLGLMQDDPDYPAIDLMNYILGGG